jgi:hypothetical protein
MPQPPVLSTLKQWKKDTSAFLRSRSAELTLVDNMIDAYNQTNTPMWLFSLRTLLDAWLKGKVKSNGKVSTIRDDGKAVTRLKQTLDTAFALHDPLTWKAAYPGIEIASDTFRGNTWVPDDFEDTVKDCLSSIAAKPLGKRLLTEISAKCQGASQKRVIIEHTSGNAMAVPMDDPNNLARQDIQLPANMGGQDDLVRKLIANANITVTGFTAAPPGSIRKDIIAGNGTSAVVTFNPAATGSDGRPAYIALAHELVHAHHYVHGSCYRGLGNGMYDLLDPNANTGMMEEEMRTVGFGRYATEELCENSIRHENGVALRKSYLPDVAWTAVTATVFS